MSELSGQATDIDIHAKEILRMRSLIALLLDHHSGQPIERIEQTWSATSLCRLSRPRSTALIDETVHKRR